MSGRNWGSKDFCLSVFKDNAGVIRFNDDWSLVFKVETHNSPSALDPYGGALTGIVGVNRDPFGTGKGAKLIFNTDVFCFADPFYAKPLPSQAPPSPPDLRRGGGRGGAWRQQERHPHGERLPGLRRAFLRQAAGLLRHRRASCLPRSTASRATRNPSSRAT